MKKLLLLCAFVFTLSLSLNAKELSRKEMEIELQGKWEVDNNNNVTITKIIELDNLSQDEIFNNILSFFSYNYNDGESVVQVQDKAAGLIVGKGIYANIHIGQSLIITKVSTTHVVRVDIKPNKVRVMVTLQQYRTITTSATGNTAPSRSEVFVSSCYPVKENGMQKTVMLKAFYKSFMAANNTISEIEKGLKSGHTGYDGNDW